MKKILTLSLLPRTWLIDLDGVIFFHNGYLKGRAKLVPGIKSFLKQIKKEDGIIILTAREKKYKKITEESLKI